MIYETENHVWRGFSCADGSLHPSAQQRAGAEKEEREKGKLIIITSHNKIDIEELCDETFKFNNGTVHAYETD